MISFKQFLLEDEQDPIDLIRRDCKAFLNVWEGNELIRGAYSKNRLQIVGYLKDLLENNSKSPVYKGIVRKDRKPADTSGDTHIKLNSWFKEKFGVNARSESIFCFGRKKYDSASYYGTPYAIFPIGNFKIIWSNSVSDLTMQVDYGSIKNAIIDNKADSIMSNFNYTDNSPLEALKSKSELMVVCDEYYAVPYDRLILIKNDL